MVPIRKHLFCPSLTQLFLFLIPFLFSTIKGHTPSRWLAFQNKQSKHDLFNLQNQQPRYSRAKVFISLRPWRLHYEDKENACNTTGCTPDWNTQRCVISSILILYVLECLNLIKRVVREDKHMHIPSEVCCKPPLSLRVLLSRATAGRAHLRRC